MTEIVHSENNEIYLITSDNLHQVFHYNTQIMEFDDDQDGLTYLYLPSATSNKIAKKYLNEILGTEVDKDYWKQKKILLRCKEK